MTGKYSSDKTYRTFERKFKIATDHQVWNLQSKILVEIFTQRFLLNTRRSIRFVFESSATLVVFSQQNLRLSIDRTQLS